MRAAARSLALIVFFVCTAAQARAQAIPIPKPGSDGVNSLAFQAGSPTARIGGVDVAVTQKAAPGYTCTRIVMRVIDNATGLSLATYSVDNPGANVVKSFADLGSNREVQVVVTATFTKGEEIDTKRIEAVVTTR
jgi:hypothetical protein